MRNVNKRLLVLVGSVVVSMLGAETRIVGQGPGHPRNFYITKTLHTGSQALSVCASGYHMASLWEIFDPSNLRYDTDLGLTRADSGSGPPSLPQTGGWIRTGYFADDGLPIPFAGEANCQAWTSADSQHLGTSVLLVTRWASLPFSAINPWAARPFPCNTARRVWCVED
jgi:hypothetical protein